MKIINPIAFNRDDLFFYQHENYQVVGIFHSMMGDLTYFDFKKKDFSKIICSYGKTGFPGIYYLLDGTEEVCREALKFYFNYHPTRYLTHEIEWLRNWAREYIKSNS